MDKKGFICFNLTLGDNAMAFELLIIPFRGPDKILLDNAVLSAFHGALD